MRTGKRFGSECFISLDCATVVSRFSCYVAAISHILPSQPGGLWHSRFALHHISPSVVARLVHQSFVLDLPLSTEL